MQKRQAKTYVDGIVAAEATLRENADDVLDAKIDTEINARQVADNALDSRVTVVETEMTATQTAAGVNADGTYAQPSGTNYIDLSTSLADADAKLDAAIKAVDNNRSTKESSLQAQIDAEEVSRIAGDSDLSDALAAEVARATDCRASKRNKHRNKRNSNRLLNLHVHRVLSHLYNHRSTSSLLTLIQMH